MTPQERQKLLADSGYDPLKYDLQDNGDVIVRKQYNPLETAGMTLPRAILPSIAAAAAMPAGAALAGLAGLETGPGAIAAALAGGIATGTAASMGVNHLQDKALEKFAPDFLANSDIAQRQNPKTAWAANAGSQLLARKPSIKNLKDLVTFGKSLTQGKVPTDVAQHAAYNAAGGAVQSAANQGINMVRGGDFDPNTFAADTLAGLFIGSPHKFTQKLPFGSTMFPMGPEPTKPAAVPDLAAARKAMTTADNIEAIDAQKPLPKVGSLQDPAAVDAIKTAAELSADNKLTRSTGMQELFAKMADEKATDPTKWQADDYNKIGELSQDQLAQFTKLAAERGLKVELSNDVILDAEGQPARGQYDPVSKTIKVSTRHGDATTLPHEMGHEAVASLSSKAHSKAITEALGGEDAVAALAGDVDAQARVEEVIADGFGQNWDNMPSGFKAWWRGVTGNIKAQLGKTITPEQAMQLLKAELEAKAPSVRASFDAKYQPIGAKETGVAQIARPDENFAPFTSLTQRLVRSDVPAKQKIGAALEQLYATARETTGGYESRFMEQLTKLSPASQKRIRDVLVEEQRQVDYKQPIVSLRGRLAGPEQPVYDAIRKALDDVQTSRMGRPLSDGSTRGRNPHYFPQNNDPISDRILVEQPGSAGYNRLYQDYLDHAVRQGFTLKQAAEKFKAYQAQAQAMSTPEGMLGFNALREQSGLGRPNSWLNPDIVQTLQSYFRRVGRDEGFHKNLESSPELMALLGSDTFDVNKPIPPHIKAGNQPLIGDPDVQLILRDLVGALPTQKGPTGTAMRLASTGLTSNFVTKSLDAATAPFKALTFAPDAEGLAAIAKGLTGWKDSERIAHEQGLIKYGNAANVKHAQGMEDFLSKVGDEYLTEPLANWSGGEFMEKKARTLATGIGLHVGELVKQRALAGDPTNIMWMEQLGGKDWRSLSRDQIGVRFAELWQGRYDARGLSPVMVDGPLAPFLRMSRWSADQYNSFRQTAVDPAVKQGNYKPLIATILAGTLGGVFQQEISDLLTGKESQIKWKEMDEARKLGASDVKIAAAVANKMAALAQRGSVAGIYSTLLKLSSDAMTGANPQGFQVPVVSTMENAKDIASASMRAILDGEDVGDVLTEASNDFMKKNIIAYKHTTGLYKRLQDSEEAEKAKNIDKAKRDERVYEALFGKNRDGGAQRYNYDMTAKSIDRAQTPKSLMETIGTANERIAAMRRAGDLKGADDLANSIVSGRNPFGPSDNDPMEQQRFMEFIRATQGPQAAGKRLKDNMEFTERQKLLRQVFPTVLP